MKAAKRDRRRLPILAFGLLILGPTFEVPRPRDPRRKNLQGTPTVLKEEMRPVAQPLAQVVLLALRLLMKQVPLTSLR